MDRVPCNDRPGLNRAKPGGIRSIETDWIFNVESKALISSLGFWTGNFKFARKLIISVKHPVKPLGRGRSLKHSHCELLMLLSHKHTKTNLSNVEHFTRRHSMDYHGNFSLYAMREGKSWRFDDKNKIFRIGIGLRVMRIPVCAGSRACVWVFVCVCVCLCGCVCVCFAVYV